MLLTIIAGSCITRFRLYKNKMILKTVVIVYFGFSIPQFLVLTVMVYLASCITLTEVGYYIVLYIM